LSLGAGELAFLPLRRWLGISLTRQFSCREATVPAHSPGRRSRDTTAPNRTRRAAARPKPGPSPARSKPGPAGANCQPVPPQPRTAA
jgi:hypothetical protein